LLHGSWLDNYHCKVHTSRAQTSLIFNCSRLYRSSPFDVIKTRVMDSGKSGSIVQEVVNLVRTEGMAGFFRGWLPNYSRLGPHTMITLVTFEKLRSWFGMGQI